MKFAKISYKIFLALLLIGELGLPFFLDAQVSSVSGPAAIPFPGSSSIGFKQEFNNYVWLYNLSTNKVLNGRWQVSMGEHFRSSMLRVGTNNDKWKDDQRLSFNLHYSLLPSLRLLARLSSVIFFDRQSGFNNDIRTHVGDFGFEFSPAAKIVASGRIGPKWDSRFQQHDQGVHFSLETDARDLKWQEYSNSIHFLLNNDRFATRRNQNLNAGYYMQRKFAPGTSDSLYVFTKNQRRDNYTSFSGDIESFREKIKGFKNRLLYRIGSGFDFSLSSSMQFKNVAVSAISGEKLQRRRKRNDQRVSNEMALNLQKRRIQSSLKLMYWNQEQKYDIQIEKTNLPFSSRTAFITPNNKSNRLMLVGGLSARLSARDSLYAYSSVSRFQYDTPDTNNFDDRDELRINSRMSVSHRFSRDLKLEVQAGVNLYHLVYIFGARSADNNWNRIFRFRPIVDYTPFQKFRLKQAFEVLANYVDYDFEDPRVTTKSFVFRKFSVDDSLRWAFTSSSALLLDFRLQLEENGQLSWDDWSERVLVTRHSHWVHLYWKYTPGHRFSLAPGYSYYARNEWRHKTDPFGVEIVEKAAAYQSTGPILRFTYRPGDNVHIVLDAIRYAVDSPNQKRYYNNDIELNLYWIF